MFLARDERTDDRIGHGLILRKTIAPGQIRVYAGTRRGRRTSDIVLTSSRLDGVPEKLRDARGGRNCASASGVEP
ncbi:hypothetical protein KRM28CT15_20970 [Krasilnikovia sp. M28-CT-15]